MRDRAKDRRPGLRPRRQIRIPLPTRARLTKVAKGRAIAIPPLPKSGVRKGVARIDDAKEEEIGDNQDEVIMGVAPARATGFAIAVFPAIRGRPQLSRTGMLARLLRSLRRGFFKKKGNRPERSA